VDKAFRIALITAIMFFGIIGWMIIHVEKPMQPNEFKTKTKKQQITA
jgi:hypothetical protein